MTDETKQADAAPGATPGGAPAGEGPVLEPEEVAALMRQVAPGESAEAIFATLPPLPQPERVEPFSFDAQGPEGPDRFPLFGSVQERFSEILNEQWQERFRMDCDITLDEASLTRYGDIVNAEHPALYLVYENSGLGLMLARVTIPLAIAYVDALLGGQGEAPADAGALSPVEERLCRKQLAADIEHMMEDAWKPVFPMDFILKRMDADPQFLGVATPEAPCFSAVHRIRLGELEGEIGLHFPRAFLDPILERLRDDGASDPESDDPEWRDALISALAPTPVTLRLELGRVPMDIRRFLSLKPGDHLPLGCRENDPLDVWIDETPAFRALAGQKDGWLAAEIIDTDLDSPSGTPTQGGAS